MRPPRPANTPPTPPANSDGVRINEQITSPEVRLIGSDGENVGVVSTRIALAKADEAGMDLVEISPGAEPPVCKILDYGKYRYEAQKKRAEAKKKQVTIEIKEIKLRPRIGEHDLQIKIKAMREFLAEGDKIKVSLRFRGREMMHQEVGVAIIDKVQQHLADVAKVETASKLEGMQLIMVLAPK
ncbi:MAG: translation initiation factor IF-3 [Alphaproteobacteria bacterium]|nr:translation initiation factor IF-3 [Alphaproteobacteria bacterium]